MRQLLLIWVLVLITGSVHAQSVMGMVADGATAKPLYPANVINLSTQQSVTTDDSGNYSLAAKGGDVLSYSFIGYHTIQRLATPGTFLKVDMLPLSVSLQEFVLHPDYTPFQKDSAEMAGLYGKELNKKAINPKVSMNGGLVVSGLIGAPVQRMSKSYKQNKRFKAAFKHDMEQKYIDSRYKPELVTTLTGFSGDSLIVFMNSYPMDYAFCRAASDLEVKGWIRSNYKEYINTRSHNMPAVLPNNADDLADKAMSK